MEQIKFIKDERDLSEDCLDHKGFAGYIENAIELADPPFTMGLYGSWGTGKTCLLKRAKDGLIKNGYKVVWFDAWKYENEPNLLWPLLKKLQLTAPEDIKKESLKLFKSVGKCALDLGLRSAIAIGSAGTISYGIEDVKKQLEEEDSALDSYVDEIALLEKEFNEYVDLLLKGTKQKKLIVLIDDLDRCTPENMVALIEGIKLFLHTGKCIFVYALDKKVVSEAVTRKYEGMENFDGERYLEKIFEFSFKIPPPKESQLDSISYNHSLLFKEMQIIDDTGNKSFSKLLKVSNKDNPRIVKRFLNKLIFLNKVWQGPKEIDFSFLAWMFVFEFWSGFRKVLNGMALNNINEYFSILFQHKIHGVKRMLENNNKTDDDTIRVIKIYPHLEKYIEDTFLYDTLCFIAGGHGDHGEKASFLRENFIKTREICEKYGL